MSKVFASAVALAMFAATAGAQAATFVNRDSSAHRLVVVEGDARQELTIESAQELSGICQTTCNIYVGKDPDPYEVVVNDIIEIKAGELHFAGPPVEDNQTETEQSPPSGN